MMGCIYWAVVLIVGGLLSLVPTAGPFLFMVTIGVAYWFQRQVRKAPRDESVTSGKAPTTLASSAHLAKPAGGRGVNIVGTSYREEDWGSARGSGNVTLVREMCNPHDPNAIKVLYSGKHIGYLPREEAALVAPLMDNAGTGQTAAAAHFDAFNAQVFIPDRLIPRLNPLHRNGELSAFTPWGRPQVCIDVDFERDHRSDLAAVFKAEGVTVTFDGSVLDKVPARLVPSQQPNTPAVIIHDRWIGNITDPNIQPFNTLVESLATEGKALQVTARIWARYDGQLRSNVRLTLPDPDLIEPPGRIPPGPHVVLPPGSKIQVTGEERYLNELSAMLRGESERPVIAELCRFVKAENRTQKTVVGVRVDDQDVGELTAVSGSHFMPLLEACDEENVRVYCRASVKGNQLKADVVLDVSKGGDLTDAWLEEHLYAPVRAANLPSVQAPKHHGMWTDDEEA